MKNFFENPFKMFFPRKIVGIDIGTASIKVVELYSWGRGRVLKNYGELKLPEEYLLNSEKGNYKKLSVDFVSKAIKEILYQAHIKTKKVIFSIPDFSTFCTSFDIPPMTEKEIPGAIRYNASQYITLPISEVTLDWQIIPNSQGNNNSSLKVFLVAIPNQVVQEYQTIAQMSGLEIYALEAGALGITRSLIKNKEKTICLVDIGAQSSTINIVDKGFLKRSYSLNFSSNQLSNAVSSALGVGYNEAEEIKNKEGIISQRQELTQSLYPLINQLLNEIKSISVEFFQQQKRQIEEVYLVGGTANFPGLKEYFAKILKKEVYIPNCFSGLSYPPILDKTLREMSPSFSVAIGIALGGLDN